MPTRTNAENFTIAELADEFDITPRAIRHYEDEGLLAPLRTGAGAAARRAYSARERVRVMLILRGKRLGMSLTEIKALFDLYDADKTEVSQLSRFISMLDERRRILEQQRDDIAATLTEIDEVATHCAQLLKSKS